MAVGRKQIAKKPHAQTNYCLVIILGLAAFGIAYLSIRPGSRSLHPERSRVEATAWFDHGELYMDVTLVELNVNDTYCFPSDKFEHPPWERTHGRNNI